MVTTATETANEVSEPGSDVPAVAGREATTEASCEPVDRLVWRVMLSALYHQKRERFLDGADRFSQAVGMLGGAAAFAGVFKTDADLSIPGAVVAVIGALALCYGPGARARRHGELARDYKTLHATIARCGEPLSAEQRCEFDGRVLQLEANEPAALGALVTQCHNELSVAMGYPHEVTPLRWYERLFKNWFDFDQTPEGRKRKRRVLRILLRILKRTKHAQAANAGPPPRHTAPVRK